MKLLNVKKTTLKEVEEKWGLILPKKFKQPLFIRCNTKGEINWEVSPIISESELIKRGDYKILD